MSALRMAGLSIQQKDSKNVTFEKTQSNLQQEKEKVKPNPKIFEISESVSKQ